VNEVNEAVWNRFDNTGEMPGIKETKNSLTRVVISWGDREYGVEEFRSLLLKEPEIVTGDGRDGYITPVF
jgi:hypothetical protein